MSNDAQHSAWRGDARQNIHRASEYAKLIPNDPGQLIDIELTAAVVASNFSIAERIRNLTESIDDASASTGVDLREVVRTMQLVRPRRRWVPRFIQRHLDRRQFARMQREREQRRAEVDQRAAGILPDG
jgi:hypothetical protein